MTDNPYNQNDLLLLIGQSTVELAYLRAKVASLEAQLAEKKESPNGVAEVLAPA